MNFFQELFKRLTLPTPSFFNKLSWFGGILSFVALLFGEVATQFPDVEWVQWLAQFKHHIAAAGAFILGFSRLPVKPDVPNHKL